MVSGMLLRAAAKSPGLSLMSLTGRPAFSASRAAIALLFSSPIFPPKAPPTTVWTTRTLETGTPIASATSSRVKNTDWVGAHKVRRPLESGLASVPIGSV